MSIQTKRSFFRPVLTGLLMTLIAAAGLVTPKNSIRAEEEGEASAAPKTLNILTIGNSFSQSLVGMFEPVVRSVPGFDVNLDGLNIGGCTLERHWNNILKEEADRESRHFPDWTYREKLESRKWDFISIQQASPLSWRPETYWPYAANLYDYARKYAPTAEVLLQQTWSYRPDDSRLTEWNLTQEKMGGLIFDAYEKAAERLGVRIIPVGYAVKTARDHQPGGYRPFNPTDYEYPDLPSMAGFLTGTVKWSDDKTKIVGDSYHLNLRGRYLQACVWFAFLYERPATDVAYVPDGITAEDARFLRETAQKAVEESSRREE